MMKRNAYRFARPLIFGVSLTLVFGAFGNLSLADDFVLPGQGCPMAHCDPQMSDIVNRPAPPGPVELKWHQNSLPGEAAGSSSGLGCVSNGTYAACSYNGPSDNVVVYDFDGNRVWASGGLLGSSAWTSAPMIDTLDRVIASDSQNVLLVDAVAGQIVWQSALPQGGAPISPVITENGVLILATMGGPIYAFDVEDGSLLATLFVKESPADPGYFETINTPVVRGNRVYVSTHHQVNGQQSSDRQAWLVALDVDPAAASEEDRLQVAWHFEFGGPSGASPLAIGDTVYFDGNREFPGEGYNPHMFAVNGDTGALIWKQSVYSYNLASFAQDPRGGLWHYPVFTKWLVRRSETTGAITGWVDVDSLFTERGYFIPSSAMSILGDAANPVMVVGATNKGSAWSGSLRGPTYVIAIDLNTQSLLWKFRVSGSAAASTAGQFAVLGTGADPSRVVFTNKNDGVWSLGSVSE